MKWLFYVIVFIYMFYRAVYGAKSSELSIEPVQYDSGKNFLLPGVRKTIKCNGVNRNQKLEWISPDGNVVKRLPTNRVFVQEHFILSSSRTRVPTLSLVFTRTAVEDSGVWACSAGRARQNASLCVIAPSQFVDTPTVVQVDSGRSITLSCQARGDPEPRVEWYRNGELIVDDAESSKYKIMTKYNSEGFEGLLTITSVEPKDSGAYTCDAIQESPSVDDCNYIKSLNITLQVNYAPEFLGNDTITVYGSEGETVELVCSASGYPVPKYRWFKDMGDTSSEFAQEDIQLLDDGAVAVLNVTVNADTLDQSYKCRATNRYGDMDQFFTIRETQKPMRPNKVKLQDAFHDKLELEIIWSKINFPVTGIEVQYVESRKVKRKGSILDIDWRQAEIAELKPNAGEDVVFGFQSIKGDAKDLVVILPNLEEAREYFIRLRAVNSLGSSPWSNVIKASTVTKPEVIEEEITEEENVTTASINAQANSDYNFYGIFFGGCILVTAVGCTFAMRLV